MKDVEGYEGKYAITEDGKVWRYPVKGGGIPEGLFLRGFMTHQGYVEVLLWKKQISKHFRVHRLVAKYFIPNPKKCPAVNHKNSNRADNRVKNLEWVTHQENQTHASLFGNIKKGEDCSWGKLTENEVKKIRSFKPKKYGDLINLSREFKVGYSTISKIRKRLTWKHVR